MVLFVYAGKHCRRMLGNYPAFLLLYGVQRLVEWVYHGDVPAAGAVFVRLLRDHLVFLVGNHCAPDMNPSVFQIDVATIPVQGSDF